MSERTRYFPQRFKVASQFYTTGRPTYPPLLSRRVAASVGVETVKALDALVERTGAIALFGESYPEVPANAWYREFQAIVDSYSTADPARSQIRERAKNEAVLLDSVFGHLERISVLERRHTPIDRFVDRALSFASTWAGRPGSRETDLAIEVRAAIAEHADTRGLVHEVLEGHALIARRTHELATN